MIDCLCSLQKRNDHAWSFYRFTRCFFFLGGREADLRAPSQRFVSSILLRISCIFESPTKSLRGHSVFSERFCSSFNRQQSTRQPLIPREIGTSFLSTPQGNPHRVLVTLNSTDVILSPFNRPLLTRCLFMFFPSRVSAPVHAPALHSHSSSMPSVQFFSLQTTFDRATPIG